MLMHRYAGLRWPRSHERGYKRMRPLVAAFVSMLWWRTCSKVDFTLHLRR